jgi:preprotein translocase subunit YajC
MTVMDNVLSFFISNAHADSIGMHPSTSGANNFFLPMMLVVFVLFLYFTVWGPQNKRTKEHKNLLNSLAKGDEVVTIGGVIGTITKLSENHVVLALKAH